MLTTLVKGAGVGIVNIARAIFRVEFAAQRIGLAHLNVRESAGTQGTENV